LSLLGRLPSGLLLAGWLPPGLLLAGWLLPGWLPVGWLPPGWLSSVLGFFGGRPFVVFPVRQFSTF